MGTRAVMRLPKTGARLPRNGAKGQIGTTMNKALPITGSEGEMDLRDAARRAARRDGLPLGEWLDSVMDDRARSLGVGAADLGAQDRLDAVTERLNATSQRPAHFRTTDRVLAGFEADRTRLRSTRPASAEAEQTMAELMAAATASAAPSSLSEAAQRRAMLRRDVAEAAAATRNVTDLPTAAPRDRGATTGSVPHRSAIESRLNSLFQTLDRSSGNLGAKHFEKDAVETAEEDDFAAAAGEATPAPTPHSLLGSTALSASRTLDQAIAEIGQRQATLNRTREAPMPRTRTAAAPLAAPASLAGRRKAEPAAAEIGAGLFESVQNDIARMSSQLDAMQTEVSQRAASPAQDAAFIEIRSMLDGMRPDHSIDSLERRVQDLSAKIDEALDSKAPVAAIEQLSQRIEDVHASLSDRLAAAATSSANMGQIEAVVRNLASSVNQLQQDGPDTATLEALMHKLADRLEENTGGVDALQLAGVQANIGKLANRLDRSDAGLAAIVSVERSMGELFSQLEETRDAAISAAENAARTAARDTLRAAMSDGGLSASRGQRQTDGVVEQAILDIAEQRAAQETSDHRLNAILDMLNGTLEKVVDRLGALESEYRNGRGKAIPAATLPPAAPAAAPAAPVETPVAAPRATDVAAANPLNAARRARPVAAAEPAAAVPPLRVAARPVQPAPVAAPPAALLPDDADFLIEPGEAPVRRATGKAPEVQPVDMSGPDAGATDPSSFIAAARRAAQTAAHANTGDAVRVPASAQAKARVKSPAGDQGRATAVRTEGFIAKRRRPLLLALAGLVMLIGAVQAVRLTLSPGGQDTPAVAIETEMPRTPVVSADSGAAARPAAVQPAADADTLPAPAEAAAVPAPMPAPATQVAADPAPMTPVKPLPSLAAVAPAPGAASAMTNGGLPQAIPAGLRNMAEDGSASAQYEVGLRLADGKGIPRDLKSAADWFEKSARQGLAPAAYRLGSLYEKGLGVGRDSATAMRWYQAAADAGNVRAMHNLAVMSAEGGGGKSDYAKAATWFSKAALAGVRDSQFNLAILYARGLGIEQSLPQSYTWFAIAAAQGDADAATKRDEVAGRLDAKTLAEAKKNAANFQPSSTVASANDVAPPPGGWDAVPARPGAGAPPAKGAKAHVSGL